MRRALSKDGQIGQIGKPSPHQRSAKSQTIADLPIGARRGPRHHSATANEYCPSSSTVARHSPIFAKARCGDRICAKLRAVCGRSPAVRDWLFAAVIVGKRKVALHVHSVVQDSPDFDHPSGSYPVQKKVTSATTMSRDVERTKTLHDLVPGFGPTNLGTVCEFANRANERVPIAPGRICKPI